MKLVINKDYGCFNLSETAKNYLIKKGLSEEDIRNLDKEENRTNPLLVECVDLYGEEADGFLSSLKILEIPDDVDYKILNYDGIEYVVDKNRFWC